MLLLSFFVIYVTSVLSFATAEEILIKTIVYDNLSAAERVSYIYITGTLISLFSISIFVKIFYPLFRYLFEETKKKMPE
jgi:hypothetical protein